LSSISNFEHFLKIESNSIIKYNKITRSNLMILNYQEKYRNNFAELDNGQ